MLRFLATPTSTITTLSRGCFSRSFATKIVSKKNPDAPKRPLNSFFQYSISIRAEVMAQNPTIGIGGVSKLISASYKALGENELKALKAQAAADRERFDNEIAAFTGPLTIEVKAKAKKDPNHPKRASPSYMQFCSAKRAGVMIANPGLKLPGVGKILGQMWRELGEVEKQPFVAAFQADKARYEKEMLSYEPPEKN